MEPKIRLSPALMPPGESFELARPKGIRHIAGIVLAQIYCH